MAVLLSIADHLREYPEAKFILALEAHTFKGTGDIHISGSDTLPINLVRHLVTFAFESSQC